MKNQKAQERYSRAYALRASGMKWNQVGEVLGVSGSRARQLAGYSQEARDVFERNMALAEAEYQDWLNNTEEGRAEKRKLEISAAKRAAEAAAHQQMIADAYGPCPVCKSGCGDTHSH